MVKLLLAAVLFMVILVTALVLLFHLQKEGKQPLAVFWDNLRSAMSSSFPASDSGNLLYIILYTLLGLTGMIFTGMLIGIFSTSMRGKLLELQKENPEILEEGHMVVLGFRRGEYALLAELMEAAHGKKQTIVVAEQMERMEMEKAIRMNVKVPKNISLITINADTESAAALQCCGIDRTSRIIVNTRETGRTVKTFLAVNIILRNSETRPKIVTTVDADASAFPEDLLSDENVSMLHSANVVARIVAHAATQTGIFDAFLDMIDFENFEFYFETKEEMYGLPFWKAILSGTNGIVTGLFRDGKALLNPAPETVILQGDLLVVFEENPGDIRFIEPEKVTMPVFLPAPEPEPVPEVVIFGGGKALTTVLRELPDHVERIKIIGTTEEDVERHLPKKKEECPSEIVTDARSTSSQANLKDMVKEAAHVIVLSDRKKKEEEADTETMVRIMRLRNIKKQFGYPFTITAEMRCENNRKLIAGGEREDFVVATDLSAMMLAQISDDTRRISLFNELLDEGGSEVYLKPAADMKVTGERMSARELRRRVYQYGYITVGIRTEEEPFRVLDDNAAVLLNSDDRLILIGEK